MRMQGTGGNDALTIPCQKPTTTQAPWSVIHIPINASRSAITQGKLVR